MLELKKWILMEINYYKGSGPRKRKYVGFEQEQGQVHLSKLENIYK